MGHTECGFMTPIVVEQEALSVVESAAKKLVFKFGLLTSLYLHTFFSSGNFSNEYQLISGRIQQILEVSIFELNTLGKCIDYILYYFNGVLVS